MKKILALVLASMLALSLAACGENDAKTDEKTGNAEAVSQVETEKEETADNAEWKDFIKEYDEWVDDYIAILKQYKENPTDTSILSDYTEMMADLTEWSTKADKVTKELEASPEAAAEYAAELARIAEKLANAAY